MKKLPILFLLLIITGCSSNYGPSRDEVAYAEMQNKLRTRPLIVIDAGHGGDDRGTHSDKPPLYQEKSLTLVTARMLNVCLKKMGYRTTLTRDEDLFIPLKTRAAIANEAQPKLFVSVHFNSAPNKKAHGIEVFFYDSDKNKPRSEESKKLAGKILDSVIAQTEAKSRGVKHGNYAVVRETNMPAILIEGGFLTNEDERRKIQNPQYLKKLALGIASGIQEYLKG